MERHIKVLGWVWLWYSALVVLAGTVGFVSLLGYRQEQAAGELFLVAVLSIPGVVAGVGLLKRRRWARILVLVLGFISLFSFPPVGTALGVYTLWALFRKETAQLYVPQQESRGSIS